MGKRCVFFLADGARLDVMSHLLQKGDLENIRKYVIEPGKFLKGTTVFPSTTGPAYIPYLFGRFPGRCNLPGIRWFDRRHYQGTPFSLRRFRSYAGPQSFLINRDIESLTPSLFELIPKSASILNEITKGMRSEGKNRTKYLKYYLLTKSHFTTRSDSVDEVAGKILKDSLDSPLRFMFCVLPSIDSYSHRHHPFHRKVLDSYRRLDRYVGAVAEKIKRFRGLDDTLFIIASDHGLTATHSHFDSLGFLRNRGFRPLYYTNVLRHYFDADCSVMVSGNSMAHYYFKSANGWERRPNAEEMQDTVDHLCSLPAIDLVCFATGGKGAEVRVKSVCGEAVLRFCGKDRIYYHCISGNPLRYEFHSQEMTFSESLELTIDSDYPDAPMQILQLFESPRTGDVVLSARPGYDLRSTHENPEHHGSHGSLHKDHMLVPILLSIPVARDYVRSADIFPTVLRYLDIDVPEGIDGKEIF